MSTIGSHENRSIKASFLPINQTEIYQIKKVFQSALSTRVYTKSIDTHLLEAPRIPSLKNRNVLLRYPQSPNLTGQSLPSLILSFFQKAPIICSLTSFPSTHLPFSPSPRPTTTAEAHRAVSNSPSRTSSSPLIRTATRLAATPVRIPMQHIDKNAPRLNSVVRWKDHT
jgi:hypothetical protein